MTVIENLKIVVPDEVNYGSLVISGEYFVSQDQVRQATEHIQVVDGRNLVAMPGVIDPHAHLNGSGRPSGDGFEIDTIAALVGGTTTIVDMPLFPPVTSRYRLECKQRQALKTSLIDFALWGGAIPNNLSDLDELWATGIVGIKARMSSGVSEIPMLSDRDLVKLFEWSAQNDALVALHAENEEIIKYRSDRLVSRNQNDAEAYCLAHAPESETSAVLKALTFAEYTRAKIHFLHISTESAVDMINDGRRRGINVTMDTCPHYLLLSQNDFYKEPGRLKCSPPLRDVSIVGSLWSRIVSGDVDFVSSDHSPSPITFPRERNIWDVWEGISGVQTWFTVFLDAAFHDFKMDLSSISKLTATNAAHRLGFSDRGQIAPGQLADFILVDMDRPWTMSNTMVKDSLNPFINYRFRVKVVQVWRHGRCVFDANNNSIIKGSVNFVPRTI